MPKSLVTYFSASGVTAKAAKRIADVLGAELYEIRPAVPYSKGDLNWLNPRSRSSLEMKNKDSRPALAEGAPNLSGYDTILVGFPIWWYVAPTIINTFLENCDLSGKRVVLFMTSGSSGWGNTRDALLGSVPDDCVLEQGLRITRKTTDDEIRSML